MRRKIQKPKKKALEGDHHPTRSMRKGRRQIKDPEITPADVEKEKEVIETTIKGTEKITPQISDAMFAKFWTCN